MDFWTVDQHEAIATATFRRPPRNLMSFAAIGELESVLTELGNADIAAIVLTGGVDGYFVAHADLDDLTALGRGEPTSGEPGAWARTMKLMASLPQPIIAAVNGQAWGGGCELALAATMRFASESAHFAQPEVAVGIIPGAGGTQRLPRLIGSGRAAEMVTSGRVIDATEAERIGLVNAVFPDADFLDAVLERVTAIANKPRFAVAAAKRAVLEGMDLPLSEALALESQLFLECQLRPETLELEDRVAELERGTDGPVSFDDIPRD